MAAPPSPTAASLRAVPGFVRSLDRIDRGIYRAEQIVAGVAFGAMIAVMALSVAHRVFSREEGRLSTALLRVLHGLGIAAEASTIHGPVGLALNLVLAYGFAWLVLRTRKAAITLTPAHALLWAVPLTAGLAGAIWLMLALLPNGLVWGPAVALACMLWCGFLGASLATYAKKHLALEMADKIWPASWQPAVKGLAMALTAAATGVLLWLAWLSIAAHFAAWQQNPLTGQLLPTEIPKWTVFTVLPWTFALMTLRLAGEAARLWLGVQAPPSAEGEA
ncbi:MAG: TRAP transporter small permease [Myxococcales bacterium]|nr:TRAP transporter small permease [Myxococcales bacterium]